MLTTGINAIALRNGSKKRKKSPEKLKRLPQKTETVSGSSSSSSHLISNDENWQLQDISMKAMWFISYGDWWRTLSSERKSNSCSNKTSCEKDCKEVQNSLFHFTNYVQEHLCRLCFVKLAKKHSTELKSTRSEKLE